MGPLALGALIRLGTRYWPKGMLIVTAACVVYTAATLWSLISLIQDEDSTAVLILVFLPVVLAGLLVPFAGAAGLVH